MERPKMIYMRIRKRYKGNPRYTECQFTIENPDGLLTANKLRITWDKEIKAFDEFGNQLKIGNIILRRRKERSSKEEDKIISQTFGKFHDFYINRDVMEYDLIYAIDSNTKYVNDKYITICVIAKATLFQENENSRFVSVELLNSMESVNLTKYEAMEPFMWRHAIDEVIKKEPTNRKIGIIIDSDLGHIEEYNNRIRALYEDYFLPDNCTLLYASGDISDNWMNKTLRLCDTTVNKIFRDKYLDNLEK